MGYKDYLASVTKKKEAYDIQKGAAKKDLWGSIGGTLGGMALTAFTGGAASPWLVGLMAGAGTLGGGAIGRSQGGSLTKDKVLLREEASDLQKRLGAFGTENITGALKSGLTAGIGQKLALGKQAASAELADPNISPEALKAIRRGKGFDFGESFYGRGIAKGKAGLQKTKTSLLDAYTDRKLAADAPGVVPTSSTFTPEVDFVKKTSFDPSMDYRKADDWRDLDWSERMPLPGAWLRKFYDEKY